MKQAASQPAPARPSFWRTQTRLRPQEVLLHAHGLLLLFFNSVYSIYFRWVTYTRKIRNKLRILKAGHAISLMCSAEKSRRGTWFPHSWGTPTPSDQLVTTRYPEIPKQHPSACVVLPPHQLPWDGSNQHRAEREYSPLKLHWFQMKLIEVPQCLQVYQNPPKAF